MITRKALWLATISAIAALPSVAVAQDSGAQVSTPARNDDNGVHDNPLADIIVTARKRNESFLDVPVVVTALSGPHA